MRCLEIASIDGSRAEMERAGVDPAGVRVMAPKQFHFNIKLKGLTPAQANIIKQDILSIGGEAAVARGVVSCAVETTDAILSGTLKHFNILIEKLKRQSLGLDGIADSLSRLFKNLEKRDFTILGRSKTWPAGGQTLIMGILNVTPDSFSDGGLFLDTEKAVERGLLMASEGADMIDVGGESTRPGSEPVSVEDELKRVIPVVRGLARKGIAVSVDTTKATVAKAALEEGAEMINDVSAMTLDPLMAETVAGFKASVVLMHMRGNPRTMQLDTSYDDLVGEVYDYLFARVEAAVSAGIERERIIIDPGLGFGKSFEGNFELVRRLREFRSLGLPILIGASRKSFIGKAIGGAATAERLSGTLAISAIAVQNGASILRVHDVKEARMAARVADAVKNAV